MDQVLRGARTWLPFIVAALIIVGLPGAVVLGMLVYQRTGVVDVALQASAVRLRDDPRAIDVGVTWPSGGMCLGELSAAATESPTQVRAWMIHHEFTHGGACAGVGTPHDIAWAEVTLNDPVGSRSVVRAGDGTPLPVLAQDEHFIGRHPLSADVLQYGGLNDSPPFVLKKEVRVAAQGAVALATTIDSLPDFPPGTISCPSDDGSYYVVRFEYPWGEVRLKIAATGCRGVYENGSTAAVAWAEPGSTGLFDTIRAMIGG